MKLRTFSAVVWSLVGTGFLPSAAYGTDAGSELAALIEQSTGSDPTAAAEAAQGFLAAGPKAVVPLLDRLTQSAGGEDGRIKQTLHNLAVHLTRPDANTQRAAFNELICGRLTGNSPAAARMFLISLLQITGGEESVLALAACLTDDHLGEPARRALLANPGLSAMKALRDALPKTKEALRVGIIYALGQPGEPEPLPLLIAEAASSDEAIRDAAIESLGRIGDAQAEPVIAAVLGEGPPHHRRLAEDAYLRLADQMLVKAQFSIVFPQGRELRSKALGMCARILKTTPNPGLRCAAIIGAAQAGGEAIDLILPGAADPDETVRSTTSACLAAMPDDRVSAAIGEAIKTADAPTRAGLLLLLARRHDPRAVELIEAATDDGDPQIRLAAWHLQGRLDQLSPQMVSTLLDVAEKGSDLLRPIALAGCLKLAGIQLRKGDEGTAITLYTRVLSSASDDVLRRSVLADLRDAGGAGSLEVVESLVNIETVRNDALRARVGIVNRIGTIGDKPQSVELLRKTIALSPPRDIIDAAVRKLRELGVKYDPAHEAGFVTQWWFSGPYPGNDIDKAWPPEQQVELGKPVSAGGREYRWQYHYTTDAQGIVYLHELLDPREDVTAYLYAEVRVAADSDVVFRIGSNDGLKCWLNGKLIDRFGGLRSLTVDEDKVDGHLQAGVNRFLLKITQGSGNWAACLRITDKAGRPVPFSTAARVTP